MKNLLNAVDNNSNGRPFLPTKFLESAQTATSQDPRACSGLPGLELGAAKQIQSFSSVLTQNLETVPTAQLAVISIKFLQTITHNHFLTIFPFSSNENS